MATSVQRKRGTAAQILSFLGLSGELVIDSTNNRVVVQDGITTGGFPLAKLSEVQAILVSGTNIKTLNGEAILGSGNVVIATPTNLYTFFTFK